MPQSALNPSLNPKKIPTLTMLPWNIRLFRLLGKLLATRGKTPEGVKSILKVVNNQEFHIHRPVNQASTGTLLWIHGGGLIIGHPTQENATYFEFVKTLGITVIALTYRLAPEHPFPTPLDDCFAGWQAIQNYPEAFGVNPNQVVIGGGSAGGGLCASLAQRIRDEGGTQPIAQLLVYPMIDDRTTMRNDIGLKEHMVWSLRSNITGWSAYLGDQRGAKTLPPYAAAARTEDLSNLPPAWVGVGSIDLFHDEDVAYAERLTAAGVPTTLHVAEGACHGFQFLDPEAAVSREFIDSQIAFLREQFATHA